MKISQGEARKYASVTPTRTPEALEQLYQTIPLVAAKTKSEWQALLPAGTYQILFEKGTEPAFRNEYHDNHEVGTYYCRACGYPIFGSEAKYESGTGWPSFSAPLKPVAVEYEIDFNIFVPRTEVHCANCGGHLGHVFDDGPKPTKLRYCLNSGALVFKRA